MAQNLKIQFSNWKNIDNLKFIEGINQRGVYLLAHSKKELTGMPDPYDQSVIYVGETHGEEQSFKRRLSTFVRAAKVGNKVHSHSGGNNFYHDKKHDLHLSQVYVSICPCEGHHLSLIDTIKILKRGLIIGYQKKHGELPVCNKRQ